MNENKNLLVVEKRQYAKPAERAAIVAEWEASGLSGVDFAEQRGLATQSLYRWRGQERRMVVGGGTSLVEVPAPMMSGTWAAEVMTAHGPVRLSALAPARWAGELIRELRRC